jgi:hypothetical protein
MIMIKKVFRFTPFVLFFACFLFSCSDENGTPIVDISEKKEEKKVIVKVPTLKDSLLREINICRESPYDIITSSCVVKTSFLPLSKESSLNNGFILQIKYISEDRPVLLTNVYERNSDQELIQLNEFKGFLTDTLPRQSGYNDILLRFIEIESERKFFYNCWFTYSQDDSKYVYRECYSINRESTKGDYQFDVYSSIDASDRDKTQTNKEVKTILNDLNYLN